MITKEKIGSMIPIDIAKIGNQIKELQEGR